MKDRFLRRTVSAKSDTAHLPTALSVSAAVFLVLYGVPNPASAQQQTGSKGSQPDELQEIIVTANHREESIQSVPYNLSVVSAEQLQNTGVTDIASLTSQVPGLSMYSLGTRESSASSPILRGINATSARLSANALPAFEQSPVGTYVGNSPVDGYFGLTDIQRVEVLRGPQGTLYGAGALGGALRIIPNDPKLGELSGSLEAEGGTVAHSSGESYGATAIFNVPIGETLAFRVAAKYSYDPGYIDLYGLMQRPGSSLNGIPSLANPGNFDSSGIFYSRKDWNDDDTFTGRASMLWKPSDDFSALGAFAYTRVGGNGAPLDNPQFPGGSYPLDPRITLPPGAEYRNFAPIEQPFARKTTLGSLDLSYDAGFATVSSTSSYFTTDGWAVTDATYNLASLSGAFAPVFNYYAGSPTNPRYVDTSLYSDYKHVVTEEVRVVSTPGANKLLDYVAGVYYENRNSFGSWQSANPGTPEYSAAEGCTSPIQPYVTGGVFPDCLVTSGPGDLTYQQTDHQSFRNVSEFGELTVHYAEHGQITFGGRHFAERFQDAQYIIDYTFGGVPFAAVQSTTTSKNVWKVDTSYEYATQQFVYALWSQGFRRGGANAIGAPNLPTSENPQLRYYTPDTVDNYETGLKGSIAGGFNYAFDFFVDNWNRPQVAGTTPAGVYAVWNANKAQSKGVELDLSGPVLIPGVSTIVGFNYTDAKFTEDYAYAARELLGPLSPNAITGTAGQQLPGSSKFSSMLTLNYDRNITPGYAMNVSLNGTYRSAMLLSTFPSLYGPIERVPGLYLLNLSGAVEHRPWHFGVYVTNLANKRAIEQPPFAITNAVNYLTSTYNINDPRKISFRLRYSF